MRNADRGRWCGRRRHNIVALAVASCFSSGIAHANPTDPMVVNGQVSFNGNGNLLQITNSPGAIINWRSFSIASNEVTRFIQQSAVSAVLNRVTGVDPSLILGALESNGRVVLINPNGITFGGGASINTAGLVVSTLGLSDADFLAGRYRFAEISGAGGIVNQGTITSSGGPVYIVAPSIENSGVIRNDGGEIILAAGKSVELVNPDSPDLRVEITAPDNQAVNLGQIIAQSGSVGIYGGLIRQGGVVSANSAVTGPNGKIVFKAVKDVTLEAGSQTTASGAQGGTITVQSGGATTIAGSVEAKGSAVQGGTAELLGDTVDVAAGASVNVSGQTGGGTILVGGDAHGANPAVQNAQFTTVDNGASLVADAVQNGNGGKVIVWSDDTTQFDGHISARGGADGGNGGYAEISGKQQLSVTGFADLRAPNGVWGTVLFDPGTVDICHDNGTTCTIANGGADTFSDSYISSQLGTADITISTAAASGANGAAEDIDFLSNSIAISWATTSNLTFTAGNDINFQGSISGSGAVAFNFGQNGGGSTLSFGGSVIAASVTLTGGTGSDTIVGPDAANNWQITGGNSGTLNGYGFSSVENLTGGSGADSFTLNGGTLAGNIDGGGGTNTLTADNVANTWTITGSNSGTVTGIGGTFSNIQNLTGGAGDDTFVFGDGGSLSGALDGGAGTTNTINWTAYTTGRSVTLTATAPVGFAGNEASIGGGFSNINSIAGAGTGGNTLTGANVVATWNITGSNSGSYVNGIHALAFGGFQNLTGNANSDSFAFSDGAGVSGVIDGAAGANTLDWSAYTTGRSVTLT
ncbi:MAG TPA: filamentous hemagglutinin N-terminal domain-containing protein, partial [Burkholderiales bacterium]|nr:filamentous hemagglutinin N-terminal domain-containing protein [Burkholderiales bacterium]